GLKDKLDTDPTTLDVIKDASDRAFILRYQNIFGDNRIVELKGYDPVSPNHDLLGLHIVYDYGAVANSEGNLLSVTRKPTSGSNDGRTESYTYTPGDDRTGHNLLSYTDPKGNTTSYVYHAAGTGDAGALPTTGFDPTFDPFFRAMN